MNNTKRLRVLVADDDRLTRHAHQMLLEATCDCDVTLAEDGAAAVRLLPEGFDLLLIDIYMPILNGIEATIQIRSNSEVKDLPIIGVTSDPHTAVHQRCREAGMNAVYIKPLSAATLKKILSTWVHERV